MPLRPDVPEISIRPIRGDDHDRLRVSHERLSPESRYRRFLAVKPHLTRADVRYLVEIDGCDHFALVATLPGAESADGVGGVGSVDVTEGESIVGVARFIRLPDDPELAEVAIVINDAHQGRGMGTELLARLSDAAVARGVRRFRATMLADNLAIHRLFEALAARADGPVSRSRVGEISEMEFPLPQVAGAGDDAPAGVAVSAA